jgi:hypothetical protein
MMQRHKSASVAFGLVAAALVAAFVAEACQDSTTPTATANRPRFWGGQSQCTIGKWTGGGRIDPPGNHDVVDEPAGTEPPAPNPPPRMTGKVTFGFNVFLGSDGAGNCIVTKGEIEVNSHLLKLAWHVSIHDGVDAYDNRPVLASTVADGSGGECLIVGVPAGTPPYDMTARVNPQQGFEEVQFEACDNDRRAPQNSGTDAMRWRTLNHGDTGLTYLTGGNIVDHT